MHTLRRFDSIMSEEALNRAVRQSKRTRTLGPNAHCATCGSTTPAALKRYKQRVLCYECHMAESGKTTVEDHHVLGRKNADETIGLSSNVHREVSDQRYDWPEEVRANPNRDPLIWSASLCFGVRDLCALLARWLHRVGTWLVNLAQQLTEQHGPAWWQAMGIGTPWEGKPA
jgi:hypothetical protein